MLESAARRLELVPSLVGRAPAGLVFVIVALTFASSVMRYFFGISIAWVQELYVWFHAVVFLLCAAYTFREGGHVQIDVFSSMATDRTRAMINVVGTLLLLLPWLVIVAIYTFPYVAASWRVGERSVSSDGMPGLFLLKSMLLVFVLLMTLQAGAFLLRNLRVLQGSDPNEGKS